MYKAITRLFCDAVTFLAEKKLVKMAQLCKTFYHTVMHRLWYVSQTNNYVTINQIHAALFSFQSHQFLFE